MRGGGLGDFILTLPLLSYIQKQYNTVILLTKPSYFCLVPSNNDSFQSIELDLGLQSIAGRIGGSDIFTFWKDSEWDDELKSLGANRIFTLPAKPITKPHIIHSMFDVVGTSFVSSNLTKAWLGDQWKENSMIWIHPGSGSITKNLPLSFYKNLAENWLKEKKENQATFCFGEADQEIFDSFATQNFAHSSRINFVRPSTVEEYKNILTGGIAQFWGNDSGPAHLSANLGIPTNVCYQLTNSEIWRPTGPRVEVHQFGKDAS